MFRVLRQGEVHKNRAVSKRLMLEFDPGKRVTRNEAD
jgi:hypothetical protein